MSDVVYWNEAPSYIEEYRRRSHSSNPWDMAGRPQSDTVLLNDLVVQKMELKESDSVVDVGCGDGYLLAKYRGLFAKGFGIVPTEEEVSRLKLQHSALNQLSFLKGIAQKLPLPDAIAHKVICNAVFIILPGIQDVMASLAELHRIARPGALVWVGEIPQWDERSFFKAPPKPNWFRRGFAFIRRHGLNFPKRILHVLSRTKQEVTVRKLQAQRPRFQVSPDEFIVLAKSAGLELVWHGKTQSFDAKGKIVDHPTRWDYLFKRPGS